MAKFYVGQIALLKKDNKRCIIEYAYDDTGQGREYRVTFDVDKRMKVIKEIDLSPVVSSASYTASDFRSFSVGNLEQSYIRKYKIYYLFHFTHRKNIDQILTQGILPKNQLLKNQYISIADEEVQDIRSGINFYLHGKINKAIHDCVPLYISWRTPMLYEVLRKGNISPRDIIFILVNSYAILRRNYCFTDGNAASHYSHQYVLLDNLDKLDWNVIKNDEWGGDIERKRKKNAEFLVYPKIEVRDFYKLIVSDAAVKQEIESLVKQKRLSLEVDIDLRYFEWTKIF